MSVRFNQLILVRPNYKVIMECTSSAFLVYDHNNKNIKKDDLFNYEYW